MRKKLLIMGVLAVASAAMMTGCKQSGSKGTTEEATTENVLSLQTERSDDVETGQVLEITTTSGDVIKATINNKKTNTLVYDSSDDSMTIKDESGNTLGRGSFLTARWYKKYYDAVTADCEIIEEAAHDANVYYMFYSYPGEDGDTVYEMLGWIEGSNSAFVYESTQDEDSTKDIFKDLWFEVEDTDQENGNYVANPDEMEDEDYDIEISTGEGIEVDTEAASENDTEAVESDDAESDNTDTENTDSTDSAETAE